MRDAVPLLSSIEDAASDDEFLEVASQLIEWKSAPFDAGASLFVVEAEPTLPTTGPALLK